MALTYSDKERMVLTATSLLLLESSLMTFDHSSSSESSSSSFCCSLNNSAQDFENHNSNNNNAAAATATAAKDEMEWEAELLAGGYTNASYKVTARSKTTRAPLLSVFAKLAFRTIVASPSPEREYDSRDDDHVVNDHHDLEDLENHPATSIMTHVWNHQRTDCEFAAMQFLHIHLPEMPIPRALACLNVEKNSKLLITEWTVKRGAWADEFLQEPPPPCATPLQHSVGTAAPVSPISQHGHSKRSIGMDPPNKRGIHATTPPSSPTTNASSRIINRARIEAVAKAFARLNSLPYATLHKSSSTTAANGGRGGVTITQDFNPSGRTYQASVMPVAREVFAVLLKQQARHLRPTDRVAHKVQSYGDAVCATMAHNMEENYLHDRECLCHGDAHAFNILVKPANDDTCAGATACGSSDSAGDDDIVVIDWELCIVGPRGRDWGMLMGWPIACALWHAHQYRDLVALDILGAMDHLWTCYAQELLQQQPQLSPNDLAAIYRNGLAWCGWFLFVSLYVFGVTMEHFTYEVDTEAEHEKVLESIGMVGVQLLHLGFVQEEAGHHFSLEELQSRFRSIVQMEIRLARPFPKPPPPRTTKRQKRRFPSYLRSISVQSWSSSFSEDDYPTTTQSLHNSNVISSSMTSVGVGQAATKAGCVSSSSACSACQSLLPRHSVSCVSDNHDVPDKITPSDSDLPFVIPMSMMPPPRSRSSNSLHGSNSSGESSQHTSSFKFIYR